MDSIATHALVSSMYIFHTPKERLPLVLVVPASSTRIQELCERPHRRACWMGMCAHIAARTALSLRQRCAATPRRATGSAATHARCGACLFVRCRHARGGMVSDGRLQGVDCHGCSIHCPHQSRHDRDERYRAGLRSLCVFTSTCITCIEHIGNMPPKG